jgi:hypothetical protein
VAQRYTEASLAHIHPSLSLSHAHSLSLSRPHIHTYLQLYVNMHGSVKMKKKKKANRREDICIWCIIAFLRTERKYVYEQGDPMSL